MLKDITLSVEPREVVVVCGPSGSGKSTLIRCINGLETIKDGDLVVDGQRVGDPATNMTQLRTEIGFVFQSVQSLSAQDRARERDARPHPCPQDPARRS